MDGRNFRPFFIRPFNSYPIKFIMPKVQVISNSYRPCNYDYI